MDAALQKALGELLLTAVPTMIMFAILYVAYRVLVHNPLTKILAERHSKTEGAMQKAQTDVAAADAKTKAYEDRLREARMGIFKAQEARRKQLLDARTAAIQEARGAADTKVKAAKADIEKDTLAAKTGLAAQTETLAQEVIRAVLNPKAGASPAAGAR